MRNILIISLSVHWAVVFLLAAAGAGATESGAQAAMLATGHALVAALFLWAAVSGGCEEVARLAVSAAVLALAAAAAVTGGAPAAAALQLAALGVTFLVIRAEKVPSREQPADPDRSREAARRLALAAAHGSMLARLSMRPARTTEGGC